MRSVEGISGLQAGEEVNWLPPVAFFSGLQAGEEVNQQWV